MIVRRRLSGFGVMSPVTNVDCPVPADAWTLLGQHTDKSRAWCDCMYPAAKAPDLNAKCKLGATFTNPGAAAPPWTEYGKDARGLPTAASFVTGAVRSAVEQSMEPAGTPATEPIVGSITPPSVMDAVRSGALRAQGATAKAIMVKGPDGSMYQQGVVVDDGGLPGWVLPVGIGVGVLAIGAAVVARRKKR